MANTNLSIAKLIQISDKSKYEIILETQQQLWSKLFGFDINIRTKVTSPLREDNHAGCFFWWTEKWIYFVDFADYPTHRNIIEFTEDYFGYNYSQAVDFLYKLLSEERNIELKPLNQERNILKQQRNRFKIITKHNNWTREHLEYWQKYDIDPFLDNFRRNFDIIPLKEWENEYKKVITPLAFKYQFHNGEFKIYSPYSNRYKWRSNISKNTIGWIHKKEYNEEYKEKLIITKSIKDGIILAEVNPVIIFQSETAFPDWNILESFINKFKFLTIIFDNDETGIKQAEKLKLELKNKLNRKSNIIIPKEKDIAEMSLKIGKTNTIKWIKRNSLK